MISQLFSYSKFKTILFEINFYFKNFHKITFIDFFNAECYSLSMIDFLFRAYCFDKNGKLNYDRASKFFGYTKNDLYFLSNNNFEYLDSPTLMSGVQVGFHPTSKSPMFFAPWVLQTCYHSQKDLHYIRQLITNHPDAPKWSTYEYFIMNSNGKILYKNCDISQTIDESGIIHLKTENGELNHFVYPAERKKYNYKSYFCYGRSLESLNSHIKSLHDKKIIKLPKQFKKGIKKTPEHPLNCEAEKEKQ